MVIKLGRRNNISSDNILELVLYLIIFGLLGGRLYHIFLEFNYYLANPLAVFKVWEGGLAIHGVLIAGIITLIVWCRKKKYFFWQWADLLAPALILGQAIGRWGNYFNQELFGRPTNLPWGIPIDLINRPVEFINNNFFHPTFLYESLADFLIFLILILIWRLRWQKRVKPEGRNPALREGRGNIFLIYLILYSFTRLIVEFWRIDQTPAIGFLRWPQIVSLGVIVIAVMIYLKRQKF